MEESQSFRLIGKKEIKIAVDRAHGQAVVYWEDVQDFFPDVEIEPYCIKHFPGVVLDVVLSAAVEQVGSPMAAPSPVPANSPIDSPTHIDAPITHLPIPTNATGFPATLPASPSATLPVILSTDARTNIPVTIPPVDTPTDTLSDSPANTLAESLTLTQVLAINSPTPTDARIISFPGDAPTGFTTDPLIDSPAHMDTTASSLHIDFPVDSSDDTPTESALDPPADPSSNGPTTNISADPIADAPTKAHEHTTIIDVPFIEPSSKLSAERSNKISTVTLLESVSSLDIAVGTCANLSPVTTGQAFQTVLHKLDGLHHQNARTQNLAQEILTLQKQMNDRLILI
ncbi:hypothetical protein BGZ47_000163 [Haplosporangium gracile]|nr:hypothetical protein BGZ47_000163 [Haplosporangium gracile]